MVNGLLFDALKDATYSQYAPNFPSLQAKLKAQFLFRGLHVMQLSANEVTHVLEGFMESDVEPRDILDTNNLPLDVIWKIYQHYDKANDASAALHALTTLHEATESDDNSRLRFSKNVHKAQRARYRSLALQQRSKWQLRTHQFTEYTRALSDREANLNAFISTQLNAQKGKKNTDSHFRFLTLERLWNERGLDREHTLEFYKLAKQQGVENTRLMTILSPVTLFGDPSKETTKFLLSFEIPTAFKHRMVLDDLEQKLLQGNGEQTKLDLDTLQKDNPLDPDIPALVIRHANTLELSTSERNTALRHLKEITPANYIGMQYLGSRCELMGVTVDPDILKTYWRFRSFVPSDLQVLVIFKDKSGKKHYARAIDFSKNNTLFFGSGRPTPGTIFNVDFPLPARVSKSSRLILGLRHKSTHRWVYSSENLPYCEISDWFSLFYRRHEFRDQIAPSPSILGAFGLNGIYTRPHFSHNLSRIFNTPHYYPLLGVERKTTSPPTWQPCLSTTGIVDKAVASARKAFEANPNKTMFSLGINDGQDWCECDTCRELCLPEDRKQPARQRWWSEPYWTFVNRVALEIQKTHPDKRIGALAYSNVARPPSFKLADNITVFLCQDAGSHFDERERIRDNEYLDGWVSVCSDVGLYGYAGLASWIFPRYCRDELAANIRYASQHGIKHFYIENTWVKWIDGPLPWIVEKLIENPQLNPLALQKQFCKSAYGPAADTMNVYFDTLQKVWSSATQGKWFDGLYTIEEQARRYPLDVRQQMKAYLEDAKGLAAGDDSVLFRIAAVSDPLVVADAFATEHEIMQDLRIPITSGESLLATEASLAALGPAIQNRKHLLNTLPESTWKSDIEKALSASRVERTIDRWDRKQDTLIMQVNQTIKLIRTVAGDMLPPAKTGREAPKDTP